MLKIAYFKNINKLLDFCINNDVVFVCSHNNFLLAFYKVNEEVNK